MKSIILKKGRDKSARHHHPWIFSGALEKVDSTISPGEVVRVLNSERQFIAYGYYNSKTQISLRLLEWEESEAITDKWWYEKVKQAAALRNFGIIDKERTDAFRLVFSEADYLPGLIVDCYANHLAVQITTAGAAAALTPIVEALKSVVKPESIYERSDLDVRRQEGLPLFKGLLYGSTSPPSLKVRENGLAFIVDLIKGQKTGLYLDQRENRKTVAELGRGLDVLDCFCYTGGFAANLLSNDASSVTLLDASAEFLNKAQENLALNGFSNERISAIKGDAFETLRRLHQVDRQFDMIILDPPKFASGKSQLEKALSGYKDINMLAMSLLRSGGWLATFSCSGALSLEMFKMAVAWAAVDAKREVQVVKILHQGPDHPVRLSFPESVYLKGLLARII